MVILRLSSPFSCPFQMIFVIFKPAVLCFCAGMLKIRYSFQPVFMYFFAVSPYFLQLFELNPSFPLQQNEKIHICLLWFIGIYLHMQDSPLYFCQTRKNSAVWNFYISVNLHRDKCYKKVYDTTRGETSDRHTQTLGSLLSGSRIQKGSECIWAS